MRRLFFLFATLIGLSVFAQAHESTMKVSKLDFKTIEKKERRVRFLPLIGWDNRFERDEDQTMKDRGFLNVGAGLVFNQMMVSFDYGSFSQSTGTQALSVSRKSESLFLWGYWLPKNFQTVAPYMGIGVGGIQETIETSLLGSTETDRSPLYWAGAGAFGLRLMPQSRFWISAEGRLYKGPHLDPDPQLGALARIGFLF